jgi:hypothetical protein
MPDLIIQELVVAPKRLPSREEVTVRVAVRNMGNHTVRKIPLLFVGRIDQNEREMAHAIIESLEPGQEEDVIVNSLAPTPGEWLITVVVDPDERIREWKKGNNSATEVCFVEAPVATPKPAKAEEMAAPITEVQILEQPLRGLPASEISRRSDKISDVMPDLMAIKYHATYEFNPKEEKSFPLEITVPTIVVIRVFILEGDPEELFLLLNQEGHDQQVWPRIGTRQGKPPGFISEMIEITPERVAQGTNWSLKVLNNSNQLLKAEISAGTIDRNRQGKREGWEK